MLHPMHSKRCLEVAMANGKLTKREQAAAKSARYFKQGLAWGSTELGL